jgi:cobaltochelatase CobS
MDPVRQPVKKKPPIPQPLNGNGHTEYEQPALASNSLPTFQDRPRKSFSIRDTFGIDLGPERNEKGEIVKDAQGKEVLRDRKVEGYIDATEHTPDINPNYVFPRDATLAVLMGISGHDPILLVGHTGCLAGDTVIRYRRSGHLGPRTRSMESFYKKFNNLADSSRPWRANQETYIQSVGCDGVAYYNKVLAVIDSGKKECIELTTIEGSSIICTPDHPIMTENGDFTQAGSLQPGSRLLMCGSWKHSEESQGKRTRQPRVSVTVKYHPHGTLRLRWGKYTYKEVRRSRLVIEAHMNGLLLKDFVHILRNDLETACKLRYLPEAVEIHHLDEVSTNDVISNLLVTTKSDHAKLHSKVENFKRECVHIECVKNVKSSVAQTTYDIQMQHPDHNFAASDFVVHNTGKTSLIEQIGARLNFSVIKISFDCAVNRNDIVGEWVVKGKEMQFQYGIVPVAFRMPGTIIILDEWDAQNAETAYVLQRPLQKEERKIFLLETLELIGMHPDNVICATANTNGQGDDTGLYGHGTRVQSYAQLNRFTVTVRLDYLPPEQEKEILSRIFEKEALDKDEIDSLVLATNKVRDGFTNGQISVPLSTRDLINWTDKYIKFGDAMKAATFCFLNRMSIEDAKVCEGIIQRSFEEN